MFTPPPGSNFKSSSLSVDILTYFQRKFKKHQVGVTTSLQENKDIPEPTLTLLKVSQEEVSGLLSKLGVQDLGSDWLKEREGKD